MNIFILDEDPRQAARDLCNKHVPKMLVESAQLICTGLSINGVAKEHLLYKPTHTHHPCSLWVSQHQSNAAWLWEHADELSIEYTCRYNKIHKTSMVLEQMKQFKPDVNWCDHTTFVQAMPDQYKNSCAVDAYRAYYIAEKAKFAKWLPRANSPDWWPFEEQSNAAHVE